MKFNDIDVQPSVGLNSGVLTTNTHLLEDLTKAVYLDFDEAYFYGEELWGARYFSGGSIYDPTYHTLLVRLTEDGYYAIKLLEDGKLVESKVLSVYDARLFLVSIFSRTFPNVRFNKDVGQLKGNVVLSNVGNITSVRGYIHRYIWSCTKEDLKSFKSGRYVGSKDDDEGWTRISGADFTYRYSALDNRWVWDLVVSYVNCTPAKTIKTSATYMKDGVSIYDREPQKAGWFKSLFSTQDPDPTEFNSWLEKKYTLTESEMTYKGCSFDDMVRYLNEYS